MTELALFVSTFVVVFALGFQSLNVNGGHHWWAFFTSFAISASNLVLFKLTPGASLTECVAFMGGGPFGIVASMWAHRRWVKPKVAASTSLLTALAMIYAHRDIQVLRAACRDALSNLPQDGECARLIRETLDSTSTGRG